MSERLRNDENVGSKRNPNTIVDNGELVVGGEKTARIELALNYLISDENKELVLENLRMYRDSGRSANRISIFHENIPETRQSMVMAEDIYDKIKSLISETAESKREQAF